MLMAQRNNGSQTHDQISTRIINNENEKRKKRQKTAKLDSSCHTKVSLTFPIKIVKGKQRQLQKTLKITK